jgi:hypothetical protein
MKHKEKYVCCGDNWVSDGVTFFAYELHAKTMLLPLADNLPQNLNMQYACTIEDSFVRAEGDRVRLDLFTLRTDSDSLGLYTCVKNHVLLYQVIDVQKNVTVGYVARDKLVVIIKVLQKANVADAVLELSVCDKRVLLFKNCVTSSLLAGVSLCALESKGDRS